MSVRQGGKVIAGNNSGQSVGNIFWTMRKTNTLNGAVECNGATYDFDDFDGAQSIGELLESGEVPYVSLADYATALTTDGVCGVFGWDGGGATSFRVPSLSDIFVEAGTAAQIGDFIPAGLPNVTGSWSNLGRAAQAGSGAIEVTQQNIGNRDYEAGYGGGNYTFDASRSSDIYGSSNTVQPKAVRYRPMVQLAVGATDEALETCTNVLADVAGLKSHEVIAFQAPTAENGYTWYRKYRDGWVEQGGCATTNSGNPCQVTLPVEMADTYYNINILGQTSTDGYSNAQWQVMPVTTATSPKTTTAFYGQPSITGYNLFFYWEVRGMAAS